MVQCLGHFCREERVHMEEKIYPVAGIVNSPHQFSYENGIVVTCVQPGLARGELRAGPDSINPYGMIHGGAMATLADTVAGCCACSRGRTASPR